MPEKMQICEHPRQRMDSVYGCETIHLARIQKNGCSFHDATMGEANSVNLFVDLEATSAAKPSWSKVRNERRVNFLVKQRANSYSESKTW